MKCFPGFLLLFFPLFLFPRLHPGEEARINRSNVYIEEEFNSKAKKYELRVFKDSLYPGQSIFLKMENDLPSFWLKGLKWNTEYFWRLVYYDSLNKECGKSPMHHFTVRFPPFTHLEEVRLNVKRNDTKNNAGGLISVDYTRAIFTRDGEPIWTIPDVDTATNMDAHIRDLRITHDNTVTFLTGKSPLEIDLNGRIVWQGPWPFVFKGDTIQYHHDFQKTRRNTYMVLGMRKVYRPVLGKFDPALFKESESKVINGVMHLRTQITQLFEFDQKGRVIWYWDSNNYVTDEDLNFKKTGTGIPNFATHANAFGENRDGSKIFVSFRDLSRMVEIDKKSRKVLMSFGEAYPSGRQLGTELFRKQHGATVTKRNTLIILNNNSYVKDGGVSSVLELRKSPNPDSVLVWKFDLNFDTLSTGKSVSGGNVVELPNGNLLVCAGTLNRVFEVTRDKKVVWDAFVEVKRKDEKLWESLPQYRANWTAALKEFHFMGRLLSAPGGKQQLVVYNTGDTEDSYVLELKTPAGPKKLAFPDATVAPGSRSVLQLDQFQGVEINIRSQQTGQVIKIENPAK